MILILAGFVLVFCAVLVLVVLAAVVWSSPPPRSTWRRRGDRDGAASLDRTHWRTLRWSIWAVLFVIGLGLIGLGVRFVFAGDLISWAAGITLLILGLGLGYASNGMARAVMRRWSR